MVMEAFGIIMALATLTITAVLLVMIIRFRHRYNQRLERLDMWVGQFRKDIRKLSGINYPDSRSITVINDLCRQEENCDFDVNVGGMVLIKINGDIVARLVPTGKHEFTSTATSIKGKEFMDKYYKVMSEDTE